MLVVGVLGDQVPYLVALLTCIASFEDWIRRDWLRGAAAGHAWQFPNVLNSYFGIVAKHYLHVLHAGLGCPVHAARQVGNRIRWH